MKKSCILTVLLLAGLLHSQDCSGQVVDGNYLRMEGQFTVTDYGPCSSLDGSWYYQWSVQDTLEACQRGSSYVDLQGKSKGFLHFRILSEDGSCLLLDSRLDNYNGLPAGTHDVKFRLPLDNQLDDSDFSFLSGSDYNQADIYWGWPVSNGKFVIERNKTYRFQFVEMPGKCGDDVTDPERVVSSETYYVSCCVQRVGDANCSGEDEPTLGDISRIVDFLFISGDPLCCLPEADVNQSGDYDPTPDDITVSDADYLIDYLFITGPSLGLPDCVYVPLQ